MSTNDYHLVSHWRVYGTVDHVASVIGAPGTELPRWWPAAYRDAEILDEGEPDGTGHRFELLARGWLPLSLRLEFTTLEVEPASRIIVRVAGDLEGTGVWSFEQDEEMVNVTFDWRVSMQKPWLRRFSLLTRQLYIWNHEWIMLQGERSLVLELLRSTTAEEDRDAIPAPPGPARYPVKELAVANVVGFAAVGALMLGLRRR